MRRRWLVAALLAVTGTPAAADAPHYRIAHVLFEGNDLFATRDLTRVAGLQDGEMVTQAEVGAALQRVLDLYHDQHAAAQVQIEARAAAPDAIDVVFHIHEDSPPAWSEPVTDSVEVEGNKAVPTSEIRRVIRLKPGQIVTREAMVADLKAITALYDARNLAAHVGEVLTYPRAGHARVVYLVEEANGGKPCPATGCGSAPGTK